MLPSKQTFFKPSKPNPYDSKAMAQTYDRPSILYKTIVNAIKDKLGLDKPVSKALDVGCGTGISTQALTEIASNIIGIDPAQDMLDRALHTPSIQYQKGSAERLDFKESNFDLVTACVAFHFFDQPTFIKEAARVLKDNGHLIICYTKFTGLESEAFKTWRACVFRKIYPHPPGKRTSFLDNLLSDEFPTYQEETLKQSTDVTLEELTKLMMTMSGPGEAMKQGVSPQTIHDWISNELKPFFGERDKVPFYWDINIWSLKRTPRLEKDSSHSETETPSSKI